MKRAKKLGPWEATAEMTYTTSSGGSADLTVDRIVVFVAKPRKPKRRSKSKRRKQK